MLNKSRTDKLLNLSFILVTAVVVITAIISIVTKDWKIVNIGIIFLCLVYTAQILYSINDVKMIHHDPELFVKNDSDRTITLVTSKYFVGNAPIHVYCKDQLYATTWRDNTVTVNLPDDVDEIVLKNRAEEVMTTVKYDEKNNIVYVRPNNKEIPIKWIISDVDDINTCISDEITDYKRICADFKNDEIITLISGFIVTIGLIVSLVLQLVL